MNTKRITVVIDEVGRPTIEAHGYTGNACKSATKPIEDAFDGADCDTVDKPEAMIHGSNQNDNTNQMGVKGGYQ